MRFYRLVPPGRSVPANALLTFGDVRPSRSALPAWVVDQVVAMIDKGAVAVRGNHDTAVVDPSEGMMAEARQAIDWTRTRLDDASKGFLAALPLTVAEGERLFVHASAAAPHTWIYVTDEVRADQSLMATHHRLTFCGHTHLPVLFHATPLTPPQRHRPVEGKATPLLVQRRWLAVLGWITVAVMTAATLAMFATWK